MVYARDLKSLGPKGCAGSIPAPGTIPVKKAVASNALLPNVAIIDPMLTVSCPPTCDGQCGYRCVYSCG